MPSRAASIPHHEYALATASAPARQPRAPTRGSTTATGGPPSRFTRAVKASAPCAGCGAMTSPQSPPASARPSRRRSAWDLRRPGLKGWHAHTASRAGARRPAGASSFSRYRRCAWRLRLARTSKRGCPSTCTSASGWRAHPRLRATSRAPMTMMSRLCRAGQATDSAVHAPCWTCTEFAPCRSAACAASTPRGLVSLLSRTVCGRVVDRMSSSQLPPAPPSATTAGCSPRWSPRARPRALRATPVERHGLPLGRHARRRDGGGPRRCRRG
ncbi:hypothetical protein RKD44_001485 [Streptomyces collinus]